MCGIFLTFDHDRIPILKEANQERGNYGYSLEKIIPSGYIGHILSPTGTKETINLHPSKIGFSRLWHNGVITVPTLRKSGCKDLSWDTRCLHEMLVKDGFQYLNRVDGAFACIFMNLSKGYVFRNEAAPMFMNPKPGSLELSSNMVGDINEPLVPGTIYRIDAAGRYLEPYETFVNKSSPYFFLEE